MKNRTIIGVLCAVVALVIMFVVAPYFNTLASNDVECVRLKADVLRGTQITAAHLEVVSVPSYAIPAGAYKSASEVVGKYATSQLYAGDYLTTGKLSNISISAADALENIDEGKVAISIPLSSFSGSLSGKLENGDIVQIWVRKAAVFDNGEDVFVPVELQWVKVVTTTTGDGIDKDQIVVNEDGSFSMPSTVTVVVDARQADKLIEYSSYYIHLALVYRGNEETAQNYLELQEEVLKALEEAEKEPEQTPSEELPEDNGNEQTPFENATEPEDPWTPDENGDEATNTPDAT